MIDILTQGSNVVELPYRVVDGVIFDNRGTKGERQASVYFGVFGKLNYELRQTGDRKTIRGIANGEHSVGRDVMIGSGGFHKDGRFDSNLCTLYVREPKRG